MPIWNQATDESHFPIRQSRLPQQLAQLASIFGERAKLRKQRQQESQLMKQFGIEMPGTEARPEAKTWLGRIGQGLEGVMQAPTKRTDLETEMLKAGIKGKFEPRKYEPTTQEEALEFERAKAGIKGDATTPSQRIYKGTAEWKKKDAQSTLMREFLGQQFAKAPETAGIEKAPFISSKREVVEAVLRGDQAYRTSEGKINTAKAFNKLGIKIEDFYVWAMENFPDLARMAFPGRTAIKRK